MGVVPGSPSRYRACLLDALGTTVRLEPPWERIDPALVDGIPPERVRRAFAAEMTYYGAHAHEAADPARLAALRERCAELLAEGLGRPVTVAALMDSIVFAAYEDAAPAMDALRGAGVRIVCVSNWDCELADVLARVGLAERFDGVVASALAGVSKPDPAIFERALALAGCTPDEAIHFGDSAADVEGANAAGIDVIRVVRDGSGVGIPSLAEVPAIVDAGPPEARIGQDQRK